MRKYRFGIAHFLFSLYLAVLVNGVVFRHAHRLADGTIICHAHPYKSSPGTQFPSHSHSRDELIWLDAFTNTLYDNLDTGFWVLVAVVALLLTTVGDVRTTSLFKTTHVAFRHRGPPAHWV